MEYKFNKESFTQDLFLNELSSEIRALVTGLKYESGVLTVYTELPISELQKTTLSGFVESHDAERSLSSGEQKAKDKARFEKRASVKDEIIATMASENMERVRNGVWTTAELISLTQDTDLKNLLDDINTLSYEIAYSKIDGIQNQLLTEEIKGSWKSLLYSHFYL